MTLTHISGCECLQPTCFDVIKLYAKGKEIWIFLELTKKKKNIKL